MRLTQFTLSGYACFSVPVTLGPLDEICMLHGPNDAGKGCLLRGLELYLLLLGAGEAVTRAQRQILDRSEGRLAELLSGAFHRREPQPITFDAEWEVTEADLVRAGLYPDQPCARVQTILQLSMANRACEVTVQKWALEDMDVATLDRDKDPSLVGLAQQIRRVLADARPFQHEHPFPAVAWIGSGSDPFPQGVRDALFDARQSTRPDLRRRWALFADLALEMLPELGRGAWETTFSRTTGTADVVFVHGDEVRAVDRFGTGIRRALGLLGELCLCEARQVLVEEPECRLAPALQQRLVRALRGVVAAGTGPRQLFASTHSAVMAALGTPFAVETGVDAPIVVERPLDPSLTLPELEEGGGAPTGPELGQLIGLVETLAEMDPDALLEQAARVPVRTT